jgi:hypothetical protein
MQLPSLFPSYAAVRTRLHFEKQELVAQQQGESRKCNVAHATPQVGFGHWSEYHIWGTPYKFGKNFPSYQYQAKVASFVNVRVQFTVL